MKLRNILLLLTLCFLLAPTLAACDINIQNTSATPTTPPPVQPSPTAQASQPTSTVESAPTATVVVKAPSTVGTTPTLAGIENAPTPAQVATLTLPPNAETASTAPVPTGSVVDARAAASPPPTSVSARPPTPVTATGNEARTTALQALAQLKPKALVWQSDARIAILSDVRPGQQKNLLGSALGDPNTNEPTPGGLGRNWTLVAISPSTHGAVAISLDGTQTDLAQAGAVTNDVLQRFSGPDMPALDLANLDLSKLADSDKLAQKAGERGKSDSVGIALLAPDGLGVGPLPTPQAGGSPPPLAYELFNTDPNQQTFIFYDAATGAVLLDSSGP